MKLDLTWVELESRTTYPWYYRQFWTSGHNGQAKRGGALLRRPGHFPIYPWNNQSKPKL